MKGIVVDIKERHCVVLKGDGTFAQLRNKKYRLGETVHIPTAPVGRLAALAAAVALVCVGVAAWFQPVSYIYMDINPSVRMEVNCFRQVMDVVPLNEDADRLLKRKIVGPVSQCIEMVVDQCRTGGYITQQTEVEIHVYTTYNAVEEAVLQTAADFAEGEISVCVYEMTDVENREAVKRNMPAKRLAAIRNYTECFGGTLAENVEKLKGITTGEILEKIRGNKGGNALGDKPIVSYASNDRLMVVKAYTDCFGGTKEENFQLLRGLTNQEIWKMIHEKNGKKPG